MKHKPANLCSWRTCRMLRAAGCGGRCRRHHDMMAKAAASRIERHALERAIHSTAEAQRARETSDARTAIAVAEAVVDERHQMAIRALLRGVFG